MRTRCSTLVAAAILGASLGAPTAASAAPTLRVQVDQHGDFLLIGNTLGYECAAGTPAPIVGTIGATACSGQTTTNVNDTAPDLFWASETPGTGQALADTTVTASQARSTAVLQVPAGGTVTHAFLYWSAEAPNGVPTSQVTLDRPGAGGFSQAIPSIKTYAPGINFAYQAVADVTTLVQQAGSGAYRVSGITPVPFVDVADNAAYGGWAMVVFYARATDPLRNLAIFDGLDVVSMGNNQTANLSGFLVPNAGFTGKLGVIAYEGDNLIAGDQLFFNGGAALSDAQNPPDNFFNSTRSNLGVAVSVAGDLPQLTGTAQSMGGIDLDIVDVTAKLTPGETSASVQATSMGDVYYLGAFITSVSTFRPDFSSSTKTASDVNGGTLLSGDVLKYTIDVQNTGNDASINTVLTDPLPMGVTFVPGSITIDGVSRTDAAGDDTADYNMATRTVTARLGVGATAATGGTMAVAASSVVSFQVKVNAGFTGSIQNQANITAAGQLGSPSATTPTDGNGPAAGAPPTTVLADGCATNADCTVATPVCDTAVSPKVCVACLVDGDCGSATSGMICTPGHTCTPGCRGMGGNGCAPPALCTSSDATVGQCVQCLADADCGGPTSGQVCDAATDACVPGCRGTGGNGCPSGDQCTSMNATIGQCVQCLSDVGCGGPGSGKVCDTSSDTCVDGCRGTSEGTCPGMDVCTSTDQTIGQCVQCVKDGDCGGTTSGKACDTTSNTCVDGCDAGGNGCPMGQVCTSTSGAIGMCVGCLADSDCGNKTSGRVCDTTNDTCVFGCRGTGGNGCPSDAHCTSADTTIGMCLGCVTDGDCGGPNSGMICDTGSHTCGPGCRGTGGNGCPSREQCSSSDTTAGTCTSTSTSGTGGAGGGGGTGGAPDADGVVPEGHGILCAARAVRPGAGGEGAAWLLVAAALAGARRRRR